MFFLDFFFFIIFNMAEPDVYVESEWCVFVVVMVNISSNTHFRLFNLTLWKIFNRTSERERL